MAARMHASELEVDAGLVGCLLAAQFPEIADLPLVIVEAWGTDNAIWRLGDELVVRLPRIDSAAGQPDREARWLPRLAPSLPIAVPEPIAVGEPECGYTHRWSVHRWLPGQGAMPATIDDPLRFAVDLAGVIRAMHRLEVDGAPPASNRARPMQEYNAAALQAIEGAGQLIDAEAAGAVWERAVAATPHDGPPVWVHGDIEGNCLVTDGRLSGIVDWGSVCAGDPAVDIQVVWSPLFTSESRRAPNHGAQADRDQRLG